MCVTICGIFWPKDTAKWGVQMAGMNF
ncbi:DUF6783 domain-containing protein [Lachnospiraceae bacterium 48-33]